MTYSDKEFCVPHYIGIDILVLSAVIKICLCIQYRHGCLSAWVCDLVKKLWSW